MSASIEEKASRRARRRRPHALLAAAALLVGCSGSPIDLGPANGADGGGGGDGGGAAMFALQAMLATGARPVALVVADLNGDGRPDLATIDQGDVVASVYLQEATGRFGAREAYAIEDTRFDQGTPSCAAAGDVNGDGVPDLLVGDSTRGEVYLLQNDGRGALAAQSTTLSLGTPRRIATADFDGDGKTDVVVGTTSGHLGFVHDIDISIPRVDSTYLDAAPQQSGIAIADYDEDGHLDIAVATLLPETAVILGDGKGGFGKPILTFAPNVANTDIAAGHFLNIQFDLFEGTGRAGEIVVLDGVGDGSFIERTPHLELGGAQSGLAVIDLNADGYSDIVSSGGSMPSRASVFLDDHEGGFQTFQFPIGQETADLAAVDLDGDHRPDLVFLDGAAGQITVYRNTGN